MSTNKNLLSEGVKKLAAALPLMFLGPAVIYNAFMNKENPWHYLVLLVGILLSGWSVYLMFRGLQTVMKAIFND